MLMSQPLDEEVRVKDDRLTCVRLPLADKHTAPCPSVTKEKQSESESEFSMRLSGTGKLRAGTLNLAVKTEGCRCELQN